MNNEHKTALEQALSAEIVTSLDQIANGDSLLVLGTRNGLYQHIFHKVTKKNDELSGAEIILQRRGNIYFNFDMYTSGQSWVGHCFKLNQPA